MLVTIYDGARMRLPKIYGQSSTAQCPFCGATAYSKTEQNVPCCAKHVRCVMPELKCACGSWLDQRESKFGVFYTCINCGAVSFNKMLAVNGDKLRTAAERPARKVETDIAATSRVNRVDLSMKLRVQEKMRRGDPLTPEELDYL